MPFVLFTLLLGLVTYWVISNRLSKAKMPVPLWLIWVVMMAPVLVFTVWMTVGDGSPPPAILLYGLMAASTLFLYTTLVVSSAKAKQQAMDEVAQSAESKADPAKPTKKELTKPLSRDEETLLQRCFPWSTYYLQNIEYLPQAMICKGKLKTSPGEAYQTVQRNVESSFGDRFLVLLQEGLNGTPFFCPGAQSTGRELCKNATDLSHHSSDNSHQKNQSKENYPARASSSTCPSNASNDDFSG